MKSYKYITNKIKVVEAVRYDGSAECLKFINEWLTEKTGGRQGASGFKPFFRHINIVWPGGFQASRVYPDDYVVFYPEGSGYAFAMTAEAFDEIFEIME